MLEPGITVVVCPLVSLIVDQVDSMINQGVVAEALTSAQSQEEQSEIYRNLYNPQAVRSDDGIRALACGLSTPRPILRNPPPPCLLWGQGWG